MTHRIKIDIGLSEDAGTATVRLGGRSEPIVCNVLGLDRDNQGNPYRIYMNALIHRTTSKGVEYVGWELSGAISTIATRLEPAPEE